VLAHIVNSASDVIFVKAKSLIKTVSPYSADLDILTECEHCSIFVSADNLADGFPTRTSHNMDVMFANSYRLNRSTYSLRLIENCLMHNCPLRGTKFDGLSFLQPAI